MKDWFSKLQKEMMVEIEKLVSTGYEITKRELPILAKEFVRYSYAIIFLKLFLQSALIIAIPLILLNRIPFNYVVYMVLGYVPYIYLIFLILKEWRKSLPLMVKAILAPRFFILSVLKDEIEKS